MLNTEDKWLVEVIYRAGTPLLQPVCRTRLLSANQNNLWTRLIYKCDASVPPCFNYLTSGRAFIRQKWVGSDGRIR